MQNNLATLEDRIENVKDQFDDRITVEEVSNVVSEVMNSINGDVALNSLHLKEELGDLLSYIEQAKEEISALRPKEYSTNKIPEASNELEAIVTESEVAAGRIMDAADEIGELSEKCDDAVSEKLMTISTNLFEASGFQDITGQRITKVVTTLSHLEDKLSALADAIGDTDVDENVTSDDKDKDYDALTNDDLLHGPQLEEEAQDQAAIDALFDDF